jgi:hypothetical protein
MELLKKKKKPKKTKIIEYDHAIPFLDIWAKGM